MEDNQIIDLYFARSEAAIAQTAAKYREAMERLMGGGHLPHAEVDQLKRAGRP